MSAQQFVGIQFSVKIGGCAIYKPDKGLVGISIAIHAEGKYVFSSLCTFVIRLRAVNAIIVYKPERR